MVVREQDVISFEDFIKTVGDYRIKDPKGKRILLMKKTLERE